MASINCTIEPRDGTYNKIVWEVQDYILDLKDYLQQYQDKCLISLSLEYEPYALESDDKFRLHPVGATGATGCYPGWVPPRPPPKIINVDEENMLLTILLEPNGKQKLQADKMDLTLFKVPDGFVYPNNNSRYKTFYTFAFDKYKFNPISYRVMAKPSVCQAYELLKDTIGDTLQDFCAKDCNTSDSYDSDDDNHNYRYSYKDNYVEFIDSTDSDTVASKLNDGYVEVGTITEGSNTLIGKEFYNYRIQMLQTALRNSNNVQLLKDHLTMAINQIVAATVSM